MKPRLFPAALLALFAFAFPRAGHADDLQAMEGKWTIKSAEAGGRNVDSEEMRAIVVTITGDHYALLTKEGPDGGSLKLDETQKPKTMDATKTEGLVVGQVIKAIYEISGDTLRVCYAMDGSARPTEFVTKEGSPWLVVTYQREK